MRLLFPALLATSCLLAACSLCDPEELFDSSIPSCSAQFCGAPLVEVGTGTMGFVPINQSETVPIVFGPQGGYHIDLSGRMEQLCEIVWFRAELEAVDSQGNATPLFDDERRVQAVRAEGPDSIQDYWGLAAMLPCEWWPDGPHLDMEEAPDCPGGISSEGKADEVELRVRLEVEDDNGRSASTERAVQAECCY